MAKKFPKFLTREQVEYFRNHKYESAAGIVREGFYRYFYADNLDYTDIYVLPMTEENVQEKTFKSINLNPWIYDSSLDETFPRSWSAHTGYLSDAGVVPVDGYIGTNFMVPLDIVRDAYRHRAWEKEKTPSVSADDILSIEVFRPFGAMGSWETRIHYRYCGSVNVYSSVSNN